MAQYINKSAVVAKIERLISNGQIDLKESEERKDYESYVALAERIATCINILSFLDTLEVKEVDLDYLAVAMPSDSTIWINRDDLPQFKDGDDMEILIIKK